MTEKAELQALTGLRGLSCLAVVYLHFTNPKFGYSAYYNNIGYLGVMMFFTLSGFLMAYLYIPAKLNLHFWKEYAIKRFFRIYPLFIVTLLVLFLICLFSEGEIFGYYDLKAVLYAIPMLKMKGNSIFWTVFVEMRFYLIFPVIACALTISRISDDNKVYALLFTWLLFLLISKINHHGIYPEFSNSASYENNTLSLLDGWRYFVFFIGGMFSGLFYKTYAKNLSIYSSFASIIAAFCMGFVLLISLPYLLHNIGLSGYLWPQAAFYSFFCVLTILSCVLSASGPVKLIDNPLTNHFGKISYSLFLLHIPIMVICYHVFDTLGKYPQIGFSIVLIWAISNLSYEFIEKPMINFGRKLAKT